MKPAGLGYSYSNVPMVSMKPVNWDIYFSNGVPYMAAKLGNLSGIEKFIREGGWVDIPDRKGNSMLYYATKKGHVKVVDLLLANGAHFYANKKGITILATHCTLSSECLKTYKMSFKEALRLLAPEPSQEIKERAFEDFWVNVPLKYPEHALEHLDYIESESKIQAAKLLVHNFLCSGDIQSAKCVLEQFQAEHPVQLLKLQIELFIPMFNKMEEWIMANPKKFKKALLHEIELTQSRYPIPPEFLEIVKVTLTSCLSNTEARTKIDLLPRSDIQGFARSVLCSSSLEELAIHARDEACRRNVESEKEKFTRCIVLAEIAEKTQDFAEVISAIECIEFSELKEDFMMKLAYTMFACKQYENAYQLVNEIHKKVINRDKFELNFYEIIRLLDKIKDLQIALKFFDLIESYFGKSEVNRQEFIACWQKKQDSYELSHSQSSEED